MRINHPNIGLLSKASVLPLAAKRVRPAPLAQPATRDIHTSGRSRPRLAVNPNVSQSQLLTHSRGFATEVSHETAQLQDRKPHFDKILIANRGEIACRVIRTARKLGIRTVAVYSDVDKDAMHVREADEAYCIGPAPSAESYLRMDKIIEVCHKTGAQAVHPGYGFLSENAVFAEKLAKEGITFIGPPASAIISMGSKSESKNIMSAAGVPCVPGYHGDNQDPQFLYSQAKDIGFPVLIKAIHGGGGKGMRTVFEDSEQAFNEALSSAKRESLKSFGNDTVLIEKYITHPRHVEVQVFADEHGEVIIEEAPAPGLSAELREDLSSKAIAAAQAVNYVGAGTVEFIFDNDTSRFYFMEMNTRLQVEHPVTEMVTGLDLVEWQLEVAAGNSLPLDQTQIPLVGHAFEARIYAENPRNNFLPDSGNLLYLSTPHATHTFAPTLPSATRPTSHALIPIASAPSSARLAPSTRLEQGFEQGAQIGVFYDPMIAKLVVHGQDRTEALRVLRKALDDYHVVGNQAFIDGQVETGFIPKHSSQLFPAVSEPSPELLAQGALFVALREHNHPRNHGCPSSPWNTLTSRRFGGDLHERVFMLQTEDEHSSPATIYVKPSSHPGRFSVRVRTKSSETVFDNITAELATPNLLSTAINGETLNITVVSQLPPPDVPASLSPSTMERLHIFSQGKKTTLVLPSPKWLLSLGSDVLKSGAKGALKAPMPSLVVEVKVNVGDKVEKGQAVVVLESMKTETVLRANTDGVVKSVSCKNGEMVAEGKELVDIEEPEP
ncbi:hypothetical protein ONZ45_g9273 [Pleurotus djamor]|nr:hypothetical protein ONZ45_g9273 [Pleurotus djamor]